MIELDHMIVPAHDRRASAQWFARLFGLSVEEAWGHFSAVQVNEALTLDFATAADFGSYHFAFKVDDAVFDAVLTRIRDAEIPFGSGPRSLADGRLNHRGGGRGVYFKDPDGHVLELLTVG